MSPAWIPCAHHISSLPFFSLPCGRWQHAASCPIWRLGNKRGVGKQGARPGWLAVTTKMMECHCRGVSTMHWNRRCSLNNRRTDPQSLGTVKWGAGIMLGTSLGRVVNRLFTDGVEKRTSCTLKMLSVCLTLAGFLSSVRACVRACVRTCVCVCVSLKNIKSS